MEIAPIGRVEDPEALDLGPLVVPIVGYKATPKGNVEVITKIKFKRRPPMKYVMDAIRNGDNMGTFNAQGMMAYLEAVVEPEDKDKFLELLFGEDVFMDYNTLRDVFKAVNESYALRPTKQPSGSSTGPAPTKRTTGRAASSEASKRKNSA